MESLQIQSSNNTPSVSWDPTTREFVIEGKSFPENTKNFYTPLISWLSDFEPGSGEVHFRFGFDYVSSSSVIALLEVLRTIEKHTRNGAEISIVWAYDEGDEDIQKIGLDFEKLVAIPFSYVEVKETES